MKQNALNSEWDWLIQFSEKEEEALVVVKGSEPMAGDTIIATAANQATAETIAEEHNISIKLLPGEMPELLKEELQSNSTILASLRWALKMFNETLKTSENSPLAALRDAIGLEAVVWILFGHDSKLGKWIEAQKLILARKAGAMFAGK